MQVEIKRLLRASFVGIHSVPVASCSMGFVPTDLTPSKPYGAHWVKEGMTKENRLDDIAACGTARTEYVGFSEEKIKAEKYPGEPNDIMAQGRLTEIWFQCMKSKGYRYEK